MYKVFAFGGFFINTFQLEAQGLETEENDIAICIYEYMIPWNYTYALCSTLIQICVAWGVSSALLLTTPGTALTMRRRRTDWRHEYLFPVSRLGCAQASCIRFHRFVFLIGFVKWALAARMVLRLSWRALSPGGNISADVLCNGLDTW